MERGKHQIRRDIGCHLFATLPPFEIGGGPPWLRLAPGIQRSFRWWR